MRKLFRLSILIILLAQVSKSYSQSTVKDIDGNEYKTVKIGNQVWFAENLRTTKLNDGKSIPFVEDGKKWQKMETMAYSIPEGKSENVAEHGLLYNWYTVDTKKLCPTGWHVPANSDWEIMKDYLIENGYNFDESTNGNKIAVAMSVTTKFKTHNKFKGTPGRNENGKMSNKSGFSAIPTGMRYTLESSDEKGKAGTCVYNPNTYHAYWWSTDSKMGMYGNQYNLYYEFRYLDTGVAIKNAGLSVRCVKN